jgi:hypothetical protein
VKVDLVLDLPALCCPHCQTEQVNLTEDLASAILDAFVAGFDTLRLAPL